MFDNIGEKIKGFGKFVCGMGIAVSWIVFIILFALDDSSFFIGFLIGVVGTAVSWVSSFITIGFGELIVRVTSIDEGLKNAGITKYPQGVQSYMPQYQQTYSPETNGYANNQCGDVNDQANEIHQPDYNCHSIVACNDLVDTGTCQECYRQNTRRTFCYIKCDMGTKERKICDVCLENYKSACQK